MSVLFLSLCFVLFLLSIACRALHEYIRHDLERLCTRKSRSEYFDLIIDQYEAVRRGFEMLRSILLFSIPALAFAEISAAEEFRNPESVSEFFSMIFVPSLPYFFLYIASRYWVSRPLGDLYATRIVYYFFHFFRLISFFALPLSWLGQFIEIIIQRLAGVTKSELDEEEDLEEDIRSIVAEGHRDGFINDEVRNMFDRIMQLDDAHVSTIMTPRTEMQSISNKASWQDMMDFVNETQLSRIPVFGEDRDDIVGVLFSKDLLLNMNPGQADKAQWSKPENLHSPVFIPETKQIHILLQEFLQTQNHFAIVLDEFGGVSGIVTLEDILEQIVGEIADETDDAPSEEIKIEEDGSAEALARVHIDEINAQLGTELSTEGDFETIGGFILTHLGRVPTTNEKVEADGVTLIVLEATPRKVERVRIVPGTKDSENERA
ncbi:MAG: HlyC/CorC family transporter [Thermoguttaceae bacterium]|nr:HlyC/CorC family transporter [Thermoguttaceae bacterium]